jgi:hypothetical protein
MFVTSTNPFAIARVLHWVSCLCGTALVLLLGAFAISDPPPLALLLDPQLGALLLMAAGLLYTWRNNLVGGVISITGAAVFYLMNFTKAGNFPSGWVFPVCFVPGLLAVIAGLLQYRRMAPR